MGPGTHFHALEIMTYSSASALFSANLYLVIIR